jgi:hypothetical protein
VFRRQPCDGLKPCSFLFRACGFLGFSRSLGITLLFDSRSLGRGQTPRRLDFG